MVATSSSHSQDCPSPGADEYRYGITDGTTLPWLGSIISVVAESDTILVRPEEQWIPMGAKLKVTAISSPCCTPAEACRHPLAIQILLPSLPSSINRFLVPVGSIQISDIADFKCLLNLLRIQQTSQPPHRASVCL